MSSSIQYIQTFERQQKTENRLGAKTRHLDNVEVKWMHHHVVGE